MDDYPLHQRTSYLQHHGELRWGRTLGQERESDRLVKIPQMDWMDHAILR